MAKQRYLNTKFWTDDYIATLDPVEKLLYLYFITSPFTTICGVYELSLIHAGLETGIDKEMIKKILKRLENDKKIFYYNGYVYVKNFTKHQNINPKIEIGIKEAIKEIPTDILQYFKIDYDSLRKASNYSNTNTNSNSNILIQEKLKKRKKELPLREQNTPKQENTVFDLILWAEHKRGAKFTNQGKQLKAIKQMKTAEISPDEIKERWEKMENEAFWQEKGFDFMNVANSFDKKR